MTPAPLVSVCIANYNGAVVIEDCIDSVLGQLGNVPAEIIVHDDCSSDGSAELIESRYPQVKLIRSENNVGFCVSNNRMVKASLGSYLLLLNNDATLLPDALSTLAAAASQVPQALLSLPQYAFDNDALIDRGMRLDPFFNPVPNRDPKRSDVAYAIGACLWVPRIIWEDLGGFPEWFGSIAEDMLLCCVARLWGYPVRVLSSSGYRHHGGVSFGGGNLPTGRLSSTVRRRALSERNKTFVIAVCLPFPFLAALLPLHLFLLLAEGIALALLKWDIRLLSTIYIQAVVALWRYRQPLASLRRRIGVRRVQPMGEFLKAFVFWPRKLALLSHGLPNIR